MSFLSKREEDYRHAQAASEDKMSKVTDLEVEVSILEEQLRRRKEELILAQAEAIAEKQKFEALSIEVSSLAKRKSEI